MGSVQRIDSPERGTRLSPEILDRTPPSSLDAEQGVLGSLLLQPELCDEVALVLRAGDFYSDPNQKLYEHLLEMHNQGCRVDVTLLVERLKSAGDLERIGGVAQIAELFENVPTAANAAYYAQIVQNKATLRALIRTTTEILRDAYDESLDPRELLNRAEEKIFGILDSQRSGQLESINEVLQAAFDRIDARMNRDQPIAGVATGYLDFDNLTGGLHESELTILAARPSMGKTALATNIADYVAIESSLPTMFVSLEMSSLELADRMLSARARVNGHRIRKGTISSHDLTQLVRVSTEMSKAPLFIDDSPSRTMTEIAANARRLKRNEGLRLVVIDYLQLIEPDNPRDPRQEQVARIARRLKGLARELKVPVLCLAQLNRQAEVTKDNRPRLSHLRESGAIEQDADVVVFVHREEYYHSPKDNEETGLEGQADLIIAKQRNGPTGDVKLTWLKDYTRFENAASGYDAPGF